MLDRGRPDGVDGRPQGGTGQQEDTIMTQRARSRAGARAIPRSWLPGLLIAALAVPGAGTELLVREAPADLGTAAERLRAAPHFEAVLARPEAAEAPPEADADAPDEAAPARPRTQTLRIDPELVDQGRVRAVVPVRDSVRAVRLDRENASTLARTTPALIVRAAQRAESVGRVLPDLVTIPGGTSTEEVLPTRDAVVLPDRLVLAAEGGQGPTVRPVAWTTQPLRFAPASGHFETTLHVGLVDEARPNDTVRLPIPVTLTVRSDSVAVDAPPLVFETTARFRAVPIGDPTPREPARIRAGFAYEFAEATELPLTIQRPRLFVTVNPERPTGLGLEAAAVTVRTEDRDLARGRTITLASTGGRLQETTLTFDGTGTARTTLRTSGLGAQRVTASGSPFATASARPYFTPPWFFLLAAVLGGALGGALGRPKDRPWVPTLLVASGTGLAVCVLYAIGVNVLPVTPDVAAGQALTFGIAVLGGYLGPAVLGRGHAGAEG